MLHKTKELRSNPEKLNQAIRANDEEQARLDAQWANRTVEVKQKKDSFIYVAIDKKNGLYKIGYTTNVEQRESGLKKLNSDIEFKDVYAGLFSDENALHKHFKKQNKWAYGEWFKLDHLDLGFIADYFTNKTSQSHA